ncbi:MAG: CRISPR-associated protein Csb1 [Nitrospira sp.]|jgi:CRISPR-associated protein Csb1|nr:MAG: CRISPR-associated protein Csb1 [Nitrospira sp.]
MTSKAAETITSLLSEETTKLLDLWLAVDGPVALHLCQRLLPVEADESGRGVIFPPTYTDIGYNIDTLADGTRVATIDTVGSQANRLEPIFKKAPEGQPDNPLASLVPQIEIELHPAKDKKADLVKAIAAASDQKKEELEKKSNDELKKLWVELFSEKRSLLDLAHRSADATVFASPTLAHEIAKAFEALRNKGNAALLAAIAPTSLVFGVWDSRGGTGEKRPRLVRSIIRAWDVEVLHSAAQFNSVWKALSEEQKQELDKAPKAKGVKLSTIGFADAPSTFRKTDKIPQFVGGAPNPEARVLGGVLAKGAIERDVTINLVALRGIRGKDAVETTEVQKYLLGLALLAATSDLELFLREGCLLRYANDDTWTKVPRRGQPVEVSFPSRDQLVAYAMAAAQPFKAKWPKDKEGKALPFEHEFNLAEAKKLLAKQVDEGPASEQPKQ